MILAVTLNAALDVTYVVPELARHTSHRVSRVSRRAGGKGVNVARVLHQLGHATLVTGYVGGPTGQAIRADLDAAGIAHRFVDLAVDVSRETVSVVEEISGDATVFLEPGPRLAGADWPAFLATYDELASSAACVVLSGSLPVGAADDAYARLCARTTGPTLVDTGGAGLVAAARAGADVLLPNAAELQEATGRLDPLDGAAELRSLGAGAVVVSLGADGLLATTIDGAWRVPATERLRGNPTGAGDALAAAVAATMDRPWPERLGTALAWSAAAVPMPLAGEVDPETLERVREAVLVDEMEVRDAAGTDR